MDLCCDILPLLRGAIGMNFPRVGLFTSSANAFQLRNAQPSITCVLTALLLFLLFALLVSGQQIPEQELRFDAQPYTPPATLRVQKNIVQVDVVVRDGKGEPVAGLTQQDFKVYDKGKEQNISQFTVVNAPPPLAPTSSAHTSTSPTAAPAAATSRYIALFFDDRTTPFSDLAYAKQAAEKFVREGLHQGDKVGVFTASASTSLDFTDDREKLLLTIESVHVQPIGLRSADCPGALRQYPMGPYAAYLIIEEGDTEARRLYLCGGDTPSTEAETETIARTVLSSTENIAKSSLESLDFVVGQLARFSGQRIVVLTSSGFFTASVQQQIDEVTSDALQADVVINSLDAKGLVARAPGGDAKESSLNAGGLPVSEYEKQLLKKQRDEMDDVMDVLAWDTSGIFFHNNNDLDLGLREMASVPEISYRIGFSPANLKPDGKFHDLKVKLTVPGSFDIQARRGYFAPTEAAAKAEGEADTFNNEVMKSDELNALPAEIGAQAGRLAAGGTGFQISLRVDPRALSFQKSHGRHFDKLNLITALFSSDGKFVTGEMGIVNMALSNKSLDDLSQRGLNATIVLQAPEGNYRLRVVIEDDASGKTFAATKAVQIP